MDLTDRIAVNRLEPARRADFFRLHSAAHGADWCFCCAWWVETWDGWGERSAAQNRAVREDLLDRGEYDGYLLYLDGAPVGWCQAGPRDRLVKLTRQFALPADPAAWAITCFLIAPAVRGQGLAAHLLRAVLTDLWVRGAARVEAFPKRGPDLDSRDLWNGPEAMFRAAGFIVVADDPVRPVLAITRPAR
ncbi:MAG: GNAT family N-acetyltransferase [Anaerolineae bacterium]|nr:GNAT family N-acetyltransferase [Anaerolineae bacterium]